MPILATTENSYSTDIEFFSYLDKRLNADDYDYRNAIIEAGATDPLLIKYLNIGKFAGSFGEIKDGLDDYISSVLLGEYQYSIEELTNAYSILSQRETKTQTKAQQAIILATSLVDTFEFIGLPAGKDQPLQWPRKATFDRNGSSIADNTIPADIKRATNELAYFLLKHDVTDPEKYNHLYLLTTNKIGESSKSFEIKPTTKIPGNVMDIIRPFLSEKSSYSSCLIF